MIFPSTRIDVLSCLAAAVCVCLTAPAIAADPGNELVLKISPTAEHPRNSEGDFITLKSGTILFAYTRFYGGSSDHSGARIVTIESTDGGVTWSDTPKVLVDNIGGFNVMSVSFLRLASGRIAFFYLLKNDLHDCKPCIRTSDDEGASWSEPVLMVEPVGYFVMNNDRVIQTSKGRLIAPAAFHRPIYRNGEKSADWRGIAMWFLSDDEGKTWRESKLWWALPVPDTSTGMQEPGVVELADGTIYSWSRTNTGTQYASYSTDGGETFSPPERSSLVSPVSPASIERIPGTGDLLCVYNDHSGKFPFAPGKRNPLVAAVSRDGGVTWPVRRALETDLDGHYCYTAIHFTGDGHVLLAYCAGFYSKPEIGPLKSTWIRRIDLDWITE